MSETARYAAIELRGLRYTAIYVRHHIMQIVGHVLAVVVYVAAALAKEITSVKIKRNTLDQRRVEATISAASKEKP